jgi:hypothetical protein
MTRFQFGAHRLAQRTRCSNHDDLFHLRPLKVKCGFDCRWTAQ